MNNNKIISIESNKNQTLKFEEKVIHYKTVKRICIIHKVYGKTNY